MINDIMQINSNQLPCLTWGHGWLCGMAGWPGGLAWVRQDPDRNQGKLRFCREECGLSAVSVIFFFGQLKKWVTDRCMDGRTDTPSYGVVSHDHRNV